MVSLSHLVLVKDTIVDNYLKNTPLSDQYVSFAEMQEDLQKLGVGGFKTKVKTL
jgi:hypothetical protein